MTNSEQASPAVLIECSDHPREFCLTLGGFRAMEEVMKHKTGNPEWSVFKDHDWGAEDTETLTLTVFGGLYSAAKRNGETLTLDMCEDIVTLVGAHKAMACLQLSLQRAMTPEQYEKISHQIEKKSSKLKGAKSSASPRKPNRKIRR